MSDIAASEPSPRRLRMRTKVGIVAIVLLLTTWGGCVLQARLALNAEIDRIRAEGYPATIDDMAAYYPKASGQLAGEAYQRAMAAIVDGDMDHESLPYFDFWEETPPRGSIWPPQILDASRKYVEHNAKAIDLFSETAEMGPAWFDRSFLLDDPSYRTDIQRLRHASALLRLQAAVHMQEGNSQAALAAVRSTWLLTDALRDEPIITSHQVRELLIRNAIDATEDLNASTELSVADLRSLIELAKMTDDGSRGLTRALAGERVIVLKTLRTLSSDAMSSPKRELYIGRATSMLDRNGLLLLRVFREAVAVASGASTGPTPIHDEIDDLPRQYRLARTLAPPTYSYIMSDAQRHLRCEILVTGLTVQIYKRENGHLPDTLDDLVPDLIPSVPYDFNSKGPLKYRRTDQGAIIYGVGHDRTDDQGRERGDDRRRYGGWNIDYTFTIGDAQRELWPEQWGGDVNTSDEATDAE